MRSETVVSQKLGDCEASERRVRQCEGHYEGKKKIHRCNIGQAKAASARGSGSRGKQKVACALGKGGPERGPGKDGVWLHEAATPK